MRVHIPIKLPSLANERLSWWRMARLKRDQKDAVILCLRSTDEEIPAPPVVVTITRIGPRRLDDDNLSSACKYIRDQIAAAIGVDDGSDQYTWRYAQRIGKYGVDVEVIPR